PFVWRQRTVAATTPAAVARACARLAERTPGVARFMVPVDLRRHEPTLRSTANLSLPLFVDVEGGMSWRTVHAQILSQLAQGRELAEMDNGGLARLPGGVARGILRTANTLGARADRNLVTAIVSHAGRIDPAEVSAPGFTAAQIVALPVHTGLVPVSLVLLESGDSTSITVSSRSGLGVIAELDVMLAEVAGELTGSTVTPLPPVPVLPVKHRELDVDSIDEAFRRQVLERPGAVALDGPAGAHTYAELDRWVDAVALHLVDRGVGPGSVVSVLAGRTPASIAAQLAVLRIGAAVLPLDPKHPEARLTSVLDDAQAVHLLLGGDVSAPPTDVPVTVIDDAPRTDDVPPVSWQVDGEQTAYITYTSGSTGRPKGVPVPHRGVVNFAESAARWWRLGPETRFAHHHTPAADMACAAIFTPLMTGGTVVLVPDEVSHVMLQSMLTAADTFIFTPSLLETALRLGLRSSGARTVVLGGERLSYGLARRAREFFGPGTRLTNSYGPTELTMVCATEVLAGPLDGPADSDAVPIGTPPINTPVFLVDDELRAVPVGEPGEMCFGGPQVAAGYLGRDDLTATRFVTLAGGELVYRTGDLGRVSGGRLEFLGRADEQVKVRGNRVEPDEARVAIEEHEGVAHAAVVTRPTPSGGRALVGYVVAAEPGMTVEDLREHLLARVPSYLVPSAIHLVDDLPLSANGKLDVQLLPGLHDGAELDAAAPAAVAVQAAAPAAPAADSLEAIRGIWTSVLRVPARMVTDDADFFALGGDSLDSLEMLSQVCKAVVGKAGEARFVEQLEGLVSDLTPTRVNDAARQAREGVLL
ncbi:MAG: non-ribosomal peptide synthetase, partial [Gordonia sp. (in: high G+C Gram-positive bacteria)]